MNIPSEYELKKGLEKLQKEHKTLMWEHKELTEHIQKVEKQMNIVHSLLELVTMENKESTDEEVKKISSITFELVKNNDARSNERNS